MKKNYSLLTTGLIALSINSIYSQCPVPSLVTASPSTICAGATSSLNATATGALINWYSAPVGGTYLGTSSSGANYTVSAISTTTYYAGSLGAIPSATASFIYTGGAQNFTVPAGVTSLTVDVYGAAGFGLLGYGGRVQAVYPVTPGAVLQINVGGAGTALAGGFNGGGNGSGNSSYGSGGGASDIRLTPFGLANRAIVAGGGGGSGSNCGLYTAEGGDGGGLIGGSGCVYSCSSCQYTGAGGTQIAGGIAGPTGHGSCGGNQNGLLGQGGSNISLGFGTGGGGGYYGGGSGCFEGAGGGSSYTSPSSTGVIHTQGVRTGNGLVTIIYPNCISASRTAVVVSVDPSPTISVNSGTICSGKSFTISPTGASTYSYSGGSAIVTPTINSSYTVTGTSSFGCAASNTVVSSVVINSLPTVSVTSGSICSGQSFTMVASGASTYSYSGGSAVVSPTATTNYNVTGTNTLGCVSSNTAVSSVTVNAGPAISASTPNSIICAGETAVLTVSTSAISYTWNTGATTISISVSPTVTTLYSVNGANTVGCTSSANVNVTVNACTGINEVTASLISVYPNPNNGIVNISLTAALAQNSILEIYDALGKLVVKQVLASELNSVNMSNLNNGMYTFKVLNNNNTVKVGKLIKQ